MGRRGHEIGAVTSAFVAPAGNEGGRGTAERSAVPRTMFGDTIVERPDRRGRLEFASVAVRKFARVLNLLRSELPNQSGTSNLNDSSVPLDPKFAKVAAEQECELRVRDTRLDRAEADRHAPSDR